MKELTFILMTSFLAICGTHSANNKNTFSNIGDTLIPFSIVLYSGDEAIEKFEINVYKKEEKFYADNITPYFYYGKKTDSIWTVELDQFQMSICKSFLFKAKSLPKECLQRSSSISDYTITFAKDTLKIRGDCDWIGLDFFSLRQMLFKKKFEDLAIKRSDLMNDLNSKIIGKWYFKPLESKPKKGDSFSLIRTNDFHSECFWEFGSNHSFKSSCNKALDLAYSDKYEWYVNEGIYFHILPGIITPNHGSMVMRNFGATFTLDTLANNELKLQLLW